MERNILTELIDKIAEMSAPVTMSVDGTTYSNKKLTEVKAEAPHTAKIQVTGLEAIAKLVRTEYEKIGKTIFIQAKSANTVEVFTTWDDEYNRDYLYTAVADIPGFCEGFRDMETAMIQIRSLFIPNDDTAYLLNLLSSIVVDSSVTSNDNGMTQNVEVRKVVSLNAKVAVKPRVTLAPFRTFLEVPQPESDFIVRIDEDKDIGFFGADGGVWKIEARKSIAKYFENELKDMIEREEVVVLG